MNTIILAIVLISGYLYATRSLSARYIFKRSEGWGAYFYVAAWGIPFTVISWLICSCLSILGVFRWVVNYPINHGWMEVESLAKMFPLSTDGDFKFADFKFAMFGLLTMVLAWSAGVFMHWYVCKDNKRRINALIKAVHHDPLESMLIEAAVRKFPVIVTLKSRKFYVGIIECPMFEHGKTDFLQLFPLLSGYRDKDTLTTSVTTNYQRHYIDSGIMDGVSGSQLKLDDFRTLIPKGELEGISLFDTDTFTKFKEKEAQDTANSSSLTPTFLPK